MHCASFTVVNMVSKSGILVLLINGTPKYCKTDVLNVTSKEEPTDLELEDFSEFTPRIYVTEFLGMSLKCSKQEKSKNFDISNCLIGSCCVATLTNYCARKQTH